MTVVDVLDVVRDPAAIDGRALAAAPDIGADVLRHRDAVVREALARTTLRALAGRPGTDSGVEFARLRAHAEAGPPGQWPAEDRRADKMTQQRRAVVYR